MLKLPVTIITRLMLMNLNFINMKPMVEEFYVGDDVKICNFKEFVTKVSEYCGGYDKYYTADEKQTHTRTRTLTQLLLLLLLFIYLNTVNN